MDVNLTAVAPLIALLMYALIRDFVAWLRSRPSRPRRQDDGWNEVAPKGVRERLRAWLHPRRGKGVEVQQKRGQPKK